MRTFRISNISKIANTKREKLFDKYVYKSNDFKDLNSDRYENIRRGFQFNVVKDFKNNSNETSPNK